MTKFIFFVIGVFLTSGVQASVFDCLFKTSFFLCAKEQEKKDFALKNKEKGYELFVKELVANEYGVKILNLTDAEDSFLTKRKLSVGINNRQMQNLAFKDVEKLYVPAWIDWFDIYCAVSDGKVKKLTSKKESQRNFVCYSNAELSPAMFGMALDDGIRVDDYEWSHWTLHAYSPIGVKSLIGAYGNIQLGDETQQGMVIDVKPPLAKVQLEENGRIVEKWVKIESLTPKLINP